VTPRRGDSGPSLHRKDGEKVRRAAPGLGAERVKEKSGDIALPPWGGGATLVRFRGEGRSHWFRSGEETFVSVE